MRLARFFPLLVLLLISGCAAFAEKTPTPTLTFEEELGIPQTPIGMLPETRDVESTAAPTLLPTEFGEGQNITMPSLGWVLLVPDSWSMEQLEEYLYEVRDAQGTTAIVAGKVEGFAIDPDGAEQDITDYLLAQGLSVTDFEINQEVTGIYNYVRVRGPGIDACEYRYFRADITYLVFKFDQSVCQTNGELSELAFTILRSATYAGPTQ